MKDNDIDKLKRIVSKQDLQIKALLKMSNLSKKEILKLKMTIDNVQNVLKRSN